MSFLTPHYIPGQPFINVKDFGAKGDGITDDTEAIQLAISAVTSESLAAGKGLGGGTVAFPPGTYLVSGLVIFNFIRFVGAGISATILLHRANSINPLIMTYNFVALDGSNSTGGVVNWSIADMTLDGNRSQQTNFLNGLSVYGYGWIMERVRVRNTSGHGMYSNWSSSGTSSYDSMEAQMSNCKFHDTGGIGLNLQGPHDTQINNVICYFTTSHNFLIGLNCTGFQASSCHAWGSVVGTNSVAWLIEAPVVSMSNCAAEGSDTMQVVVLSTSKFSWVGGAVFSGNVNGGNNTNGVQIGQASGKSNPYLYCSYQAAGLTTAVFPTNYVVQTQFDKCQGPLGSVYMEADGGYGVIEGPVFFDTSVDWHTYTSCINAPGVLTGSGYSISGYQRTNRIDLFPKIPYGTQDGTVAKGGFYQIPVHAFKAVCFTDGSQDIFNFNTWFGPVPRCEFPNGCEIRNYSDNFVTPSFRASHGKIGVLESAASAVTANNGTITTAGVGVARVNPAANVTGVILQAGTTEATAMGGGGLFLIVQNESAFTLTFDVVGTSNVADGVSDVIPALRAAQFEWSAKKSLWYRVGG